MTRPRRAIAASLASLAPLLGACLELKNAEPPMCETTADCAEGEICEERICWGNPPAGSFAAVISPPSERGGNLASRELRALPISSDGWMEDVRLAAAITYEGRLQSLCEAPLICDDRKLGATVTIARGSAVEGGPVFHKVVTIEAGQERFELSIPPSEPADRDYTITVVPNGRDDPGELDSLARQVPPLRIDRLKIPVSIKDNVIELGGLDLPRVTGQVVSSTGAPQAGYRVVALGRWVDDAIASEVSTVDFTGPDGRYELRLSRAIAGDVEIVARPIGPPLRPSLHLGSIASGADSTNRVLTRPVSAESAELPVEIVVTQSAPGGGISRVAGARVMITGKLSTANNAIARIAVEGITDADGAVTLKILHGDPLSSTYSLSVIPPARSPAAAVFEQRYEPSALKTLQLPTRLAIVGIVHGKDHEPLKDVSVTARPSLRFQWSLEPGPQAFLGAIPTPTVVTTGKGEFVLFIDHALANANGGQPATVWGHYDLVFEPPATSRSASWVQQELELPRDATQAKVDVSVIKLPDAAFARGRVFDPAGAAIEGAEVKLYRVPPQALCAETRHHPTKCAVPADISGHGTSDKAGIVRLTLPR